MLKNKCCYLCLSNNIRTIDIYKTDLQFIYENLADSKIRGNECWMCYICHTRLRQCHRLRKLAVQTQGLIDNLCEKKIDLFGTSETLLELSIHNETVISVPLPSSYIKQEPDVKTEPNDDDGNFLELEQDEILENDHVAENKFFIDAEGPLDRTGQEIYNVENDAHQKSNVFKFETEKCSQIAIDKHFRQSPTTHPLTETYLEEKGEQTWGEQSTKNPEIKQEIEDNGTIQDVERKNTSDREGENSKNLADNDQLLKPIGNQNAKKHFICDICSKKFAYKARLKCHILTHTTNISFKCEICSKKFPRMYELNRHIMTHTGEQPFHCDICSKRYTTKSYLRQHKLIHTGEQPFCCDICPKKFTRNSTLREHKLSHTNEKPFCCDICPMKFRIKTHLKTHKEIHTGEQPFCCDICSKKFRLKGNLKQHKLVHTGERPFSCDICSKKFTQKSSLNQHKLSHTSEKPYCCDICSKKFRLKTHLKRHKQVHTGEQPFSCDICSKKFTQRGNLKLHKLIHTGEKPFSCEICLKNFTQKSQLYSHIMLVHIDKRQPII